MPVPTDIKALTDGLNKRANQYLVGHLQDIRLDLKLKSKPTSEIFAGNPPGDDYAFHTGSKSRNGHELQFNVGLMTHGPESPKGGDLEVRQALAVSFQGGRYAPDDVVGEMLPKAQLFNQYLRDHPDAYSDLRMWDHKNREEWRGYRAPGPIDLSRAEKGRIFMLGRRLPPDEVDYSDILQLFDRLLPIYVFAESGGDADLASMWSGRPETFDFRPGMPETQETARMERSGSEVGLELRHNRLQKKLFAAVAEEVGSENVGAEVDTGSGGRIDLVAQEDLGWIFYEIKVGRSPRACIRDAIGQLLEYSLWPGSERPEKVVVVGEEEIGSEARRYLERLNSNLSLQVEYRHVLLDPETA